MKTKRWLSFAAFTAVVLALAACGGGGGTGDNSPTASIPTPPSGTTASSVSPAATITGTVTLATGCTIAAGQKTCPATVSYTSTGATSPSLDVGTTSVSTAASGTNLSVPIGNGTFHVVLANGATVLDGSQAVTGTCTTGTTWSSDVGCFTPLAGDVFYAVTAFESLQELDLVTGKVIPVVNATGYQFINIAEGRPVAPDGKKLFRATETTGYTSVYFYLGADNALHPYTTPVPTGMTWVVTGIGANYPYWATQATSGGTTCYVDTAKPSYVQCKDAAGQPTVTFGPWPENDGGVPDVFVVTF